MDAIRIDPEFQKKIPPLTDEEYAQLKENILKDREVYEPIILWKGIIIDGHNRWKIVLEHPEIIFHTREMDFPNKWAAFEWMYKNQLGRRNLTDPQRTMLIGKMHEARGYSQGGNRGNQYTKVAKRQNGVLPKSKSTSDVLAEELGLSSRTVDRAASYSKGIDAIRRVSEKAADMILSGGSGVLKKDVMRFRSMEPEDLQKVADAIISGQALPETLLDKESTPKSAIQSDQTTEPFENTPPSLQEIQAKPLSEDHSRKPRLDPEIERINAEARDLESVHEYTLDDMLTEMGEIAHTLTSQLRRVLTIRSTLLRTTDAKERVSAFLTASIHALEELRTQLK